MTEEKQIYKCQVCGNIVEITHNGAGELHCCNKPMQEMKENTQEAATEKHIPTIKDTESGIQIIIGEVLHPMTEEHYIEWIEIITEKKVMRHHLKPGESPEMKCKVPKEKIKTIRAYCNLHGLWSLNLS